MNKFKKELTIIIEGESSEILEDKELFKKLEIKIKNWWENNPSWPYGKPCDKLVDVKIKNIILKN